jgi:polyphosphate kinase
MSTAYFDRDLSWLSFNGRVLTEAGNRNVPLLERIRFLSIFSSNLDEFYRVRMPVVLSFKGAAGEDGEAVAAKARNIIKAQQEYFGNLLRSGILPELKQHNIHLLYNEPLPAKIRTELHQYFFSTIAAFLRIADLSGNEGKFFSENNQLYQVVLLETQAGREELRIISVPSGHLPRFFSTTAGGLKYIVFLEDIIQEFLHIIFPGATIKASFNFKVTRNAELGLDDEHAGDLAEKIASRIALRELGSPTRFLYQQGVPLRILYWLAATLNLSAANMVEGGKYHNLKDLAAIPVADARFCYPPWPASDMVPGQSLFESILLNDRIIHTPYQSYNSVLRFFGEAAIDPAVEEIFVTLYRIASDSRIANALITAALNGKKVVVFVELKARFDEANNIRWGKKMKDAGIRIIYSIPDLKVHAKIALVKRRQGDRIVPVGLLSTGNFNESTAKFYTDHILFTSNHHLLEELERLFLFLSLKRKPVHPAELVFDHLLVAQFNLQEVFLRLIDNEIKNAVAGLPAAITLKMNNLEEKKMIAKLYDAAQAGVKVQLIIRSICCLRPGQTGRSENITVRRIVDRFLEHGRVFIFHNNNSELIYLGSADWMNRNIYSRIEVCFPVYDASIRRGLRAIIDLELADNMQAVQINAFLENIPVKAGIPAVRSQEEIYRLLSSE